MAYKVGDTYKAPGDTLAQSVDFTDDLPTGVTLSSAVSTNVSGGTLSVSGTTNDDAIATVTLTGGRKGQTYVVEVVGTYSDGQVRGFAIGVIVV